MILCWVEDYYIHFLLIRYEPIHLIFAVTYMACLYKKVLMHLTHGKLLKKLLQPSEGS